VTSNERWAFEETRERDGGWEIFGHCFEDGVPEEKEALRPVRPRVVLEEEEGPAADDLRFASRFIKVLNLRGL
jgi:hypothetical protein